MTLPSCPFCGHDDTCLTQQIRFRSVGCSHCGATGPYAATNEGAIALWSKRSPAPADKETGSAENGGDGKLARVIKKHVVGSGITVEVLEDLSLVFGVNEHAAVQDKFKNYLARCTPAQAVLFAEWLIESGVEMARASRRNVACDHAHWTMAKYGRTCTCGEMMFNPGD